MTIIFHSFLYLKNTLNFVCIFFSIWLYGYLFGKIIISCVTYSQDQNISTDFVVLMTPLFLNNFSHHLTHRHPHFFSENKHFKFTYRKK